MRWWRIYRPKYDDPLSGEGARLWGGRWNLKGEPALYLASSASLAMAEKLVQAETAFRATGFIAAEVEIDVRHLPLFTVHDLPDGWDDNPQPQVSRQFGHDQFAAGGLGFRVPSAVVPFDVNAVVCTTHKSFSKQVKLVRSGIPFPFDLRLISAKR